MTKILIPTDFSENSKKTIRFALQFATQMAGSELIFYHVLDIAQPSVWTDKQFGEFIAKEKDRKIKILHQFVRTIAIAAKFDVPEYHCEVDWGTTVGGCIQAYGEKNAIDYACIGMCSDEEDDHDKDENEERMFGQYAKYLLIHAKFPIIVVPEAYRIQTLEMIFYASDLENISGELYQVQQLANKLGINTIEAYNYIIPFESPKITSKRAEIMEIYPSGNTSFHVAESKTGYLIIKQLQEDINQTRHALSVLFAKPDSSWYEKMFALSPEREMNFQSKVPMLVLRK